MVGDGIIMFYSLLLIAWIAISIVVSLLLGRMCGLGRHERN